MPERLVVAVLAGGDSRRMGTDKAFVRVAGRPMAEWVLEAAHTVGDAIVVGRRDPLLGTPSIPDAGGSGPAAGLATALSMSDGRPVLLLAVDQPWVVVSTLEHILSHFDGRTPVVPEDGGISQVTCALFPPSLEGAMTTAASEHGSIRSRLDPDAIVDPTIWRRWGEDGRSWHSADTREAIAAGIERYGAPGTT